MARKEDRSRTSIEFADQLRWQFPSAIMAQPFAILLRPTEDHQRHTAPMLFQECKSFPQCLVLVMIADEQEIIV